MAGYEYKRARNGLSKPRAVDSWRDNLLTWELNVTGYYGREHGEDILSDVLDLMQQHYPGSYTLAWTNTAPMEYHLTPVFESDRHQTLFMLKYPT